MKSHPELQQIAQDPNAFYAVAQHYGIPTPYLDFTTEPAIAGFFACDTQSPEPGSDSCIYCLNTEDIQEAWKALVSVDRRAEIELVTAPVPNLWRLESQHGVFLYASRVTGIFGTRWTRSCSPTEVIRLTRQETLSIPTKKALLKTCLIVFSSKSGAKKVGGACSMHYRHSLTRFL